MRKPKRKKRVHGEGRLNRTRRKHIRQLTKDSYWILGDEE